MKNYTSNEVMAIYENAGALMYKATLEGDYKTNNREGKKLIKFFELFEQEKEFGQQCIDRLLASNNIVIRTKAAAYCLSLKYNIENAVSELENIANNQANGIFGFNAKMTLDVWKEKGFLKIYQDQKIFT